MHRFGFLPVPHRTWPDLQRMKLPATLVLVKRLSELGFAVELKPLAA
jgi:hypothetical protein